MFMIFYQGYTGPNPYRIMREVDGNSRKSWIFKDVQTELRFMVSSMLPIVVGVSGSFNDELHFVLSSKYVFPF